MTEIIIAKSTKDETNLQNVSSGEVFEAFVQSQKSTGNKRGLSDLGAINLRTSTSDILNHCNPHTAVNNTETTHLVVGYVQSGKTMSFTGVLALAKDNGYRVAIVLTGITTNLKNQTAERLAHDLDLDDNEDWFRFIENPDKKDTSDIIKALRLSHKPMIIIPILKHKKYLDNLKDIFANEKLRKMLDNETVLIIDDEADQASLNSYGYQNSKITDPSVEEQESATYAAILRLRNKLPANSYIQYTATPQANILITTADLLSPKSHTILIPGEEYIGGKKFFGLEPDGSLYNGKLVITIPEKEVYHKKRNALGEMPKSLRQALMMHVLAVVLVTKWYKRPGIKQLTMMVHPTDIIEGNKIFEQWIRETIEFWSDCFEKPQFSDDRTILLKQFELLFPDAIQFYPAEGRPLFPDIATYISDVINDSAIYRITGDSDDDGKNIKWNQHRMNILVGAQMLNRGFTVEKLATTYMPRYSTSITNADTIEQRCRFFGYKKDYIESCRVYLPEDSIRDYKSYVQHEEELRNLLASCSSLKEYEHKVMISPNLRPTRLNVLPKQMVRTRLVGWVQFQHIVIGNMISNNNNVIADFVKRHIDDASDFSIKSYKSSKYDKGEIKRHLMSKISVDDIIPLLTNYATGSFSQSLQKAMIMRYLQYLDSMGQKHIEVIFMSGDMLRERSLISVNTNDSNDSGKIELFQGQSNINEPDDYCGDRNIYSKDVITLQIHHIKIKGLPISHSTQPETYALALHFPEKLQIMYCESVSKNFHQSE